MTNFKQARSTLGVTLIELITTIGIIAVLTSVVIPSFQSILQNNKIDSATMQLFTVLSIARQNAIASGKDTYVCELIENQQCNSHRPYGAVWNNGWLTYQDNNNNSELDDNDTILSTHQNQRNIGVIFNQRGRLRFRNNGSARSAGFYICTHDASKHILLLYSGRARVRNLTNQDRIEQCKQNL